MPQIMSLRTLAGFFRNTCRNCYSRDIRFSRRQNYSRKNPKRVVLHPPFPVSKLLESILEIGIGTTPTGIVCSVQKPCCRHSTISLQHGRSF